jgi:hypothetical protein
MSIGLHSFEGWPFMFKVKDHEGMSPSKHILSSWGQGLKMHLKLAHNAPMPLTHPLGTSSKIMHVLQGMVMWCEPLIKFNLEFVPRPNVHQVRFHVFQHHPPFHIVVLK